MSLKKAQRNNGWKPPKFGERQKPTDSRSFRIYLKKSRLRHTITKHLKTKHKEAVLKVIRGKQHITCRPPIQTTDFSSENTEARIK